MPSIGPLELIIVLVIALVLLGPKRLPSAAQALGRGINEFRRGLTEQGGERSASPDPSEAEIPQARAPAAATTGDETATSAAPATTSSSAEPVSDTRPRSSEERSSP
jgi:sec-independent protein translocase protein TatA